MSSKDPLLLSVVIPTHNRPQFLPRAVQSALDSLPDGDGEVIVVPNGPDESWHGSLAPFIDNRRVVVSPIEVANANTARNHGMRLAAGKYLRFLDDDDYLLPAVTRQLEVIQHAQADICSGLLASVDQDGTSLGQVGFPATRDFVCAAVSVSGFTLPTGNLFNRNALNGYHWDVNIHRAQDFVWMIDLAASREWRWVHLEEQVGAWFQHDRQRTSSVAPFTNTVTQLVERLSALHENLLHTGRLDSGRRQAIADALWRYAHSGFPYHPLYWTQIARRARTIDPIGRPPEPFFRTGPFRAIHPILGEWLLLPVRKLTRAMRDTHAYWRGQDYRRRL